MRIFNSVQQCSRYCVKFLKNKYLQIVDGTETILGNGHCNGSFAPLGLLAAACGDEAAQVKSMMRFITGDDTLDVST